MKTIFRPRKFRGSAGFHNVDLVSGRIMLSGRELSQSDLGNSRRWGSTSALWIMLCTISQTGCDGLGLRSAAFLKVSPRTAQQETPRSREYKATCRCSGNPLLYTNSHQGSPVSVVEQYTCIIRPKISSLCTVGRVLCTRKFTSFRNRFKSSCGCTRLCIVVRTASSGETCAGWGVVKCAHGESKKG